MINAHNNVAQGRKPSGGDRLLVAERDRCIDARDELVSRPAKSTWCACGAGVWLPCWQFRTWAHWRACRAEIADNRSKPRDIDEERIVALWRGQGRGNDLCTTCEQAVGDLLLLLQREQDVGFHPDHQRALQANAALRDVVQHPRRISTAMVGEVEPVHRAAQVEIAVRVELTHETASMAFEVTLNLELEAERVVAFALFAVEPDASEASASIRATSHT